MAETKQLTKRVLLIVDPQNDFISGSLAVPGATEAMDRLTEYIKTNGYVYNNIIVTQDAHPLSHCSFESNGGIWPVHCVKDTEGYEVYKPLKDELDRLNNVTYILKGENENKEEYSAFHDPNFRPFALDREEYEHMQIEVCGIAGDFCVKTSIEDLVKNYPDYFIAIRERFIASIDGGEALNKLAKRLEPLKESLSYGQIVKDIADNDFYTFTCMFYVLSQFSRAEVVYEFFDRNQEEYPEGFDLALRQQMYGFSKCKFSKECADYLRKTANFLPEWFITFLENYKPNFDNLKIWLDEEKHLHVEVKGKWWEAIIWEMPILSTVSELMHMYRGEINQWEACNSLSDWYDSPEYRYASAKMKECMHYGLRIAEMGTRRRFSYAHQNLVIKALRDTYLEHKDEYSGAFLGTSNVKFATEYNLTPIGTMSHQISSFIGGVVSNVFEAGYLMLKSWSEVFKGNVGIALTDCYTTKLFLNSLTLEQAKLWDGFRVDSGDEKEIYDMFVSKLLSFNINPKEKAIVFSNGLDIDKAIDIQKYVESSEYPMKASYGIGTFLTCDLELMVIKTTENGDYYRKESVKPMNIVVKAVKGRITETREWHDLVKLSDDIGKAIGSKWVIDYIKEEIELYNKEDK